MSENPSDDFSQEEAAPKDEREVRARHVDISDVHIENAPRLSSALNAPAGVFYIIRKE